MLGSAGFHRYAGEMSEGQRGPDSNPYSRFRRHLPLRLRQQRSGRTLNSMTTSQTQAATCNIPNRTIFEGDNLDVMRGINDDCIDLIYLDPPFNSNRDYAAPIGSEAAGAAFKDTWDLTDVDEAWHNEIAETDLPLYKIIDASQYSRGSGMKSYLIMMAVRLLEMRRILKSTGSIYLHCDDTASHYLKTLMDAVFGAANFRNEIVWHYKTFHGQVRRYFPRKHDTLLMYTKGDSWTFNQQFEEDNTHTVDFRRWRAYLEEGRYIRARNMPSHDSRFVRYLRRWIRENGRDPSPNDVVYEVRGQALDSVWDIKAIDPKDTVQKTGYPTQKPLSLLERLITASSNPGDVVLDPFCGCATTCIAAERLDRQWVGIDLSSMAVKLVEQRARNELGLMGGVQAIARSDIPMRTDREPPPPLRESKIVLYGTQAGHCNGCGTHFMLQHLTVDHIIATVKGGTDHIENLQLLCNHCNSLKGDRPMEYLRARLAREYV